ncbi:hypothetical protein JW935_19890 [candidate division KSB1 bacterium]|nr:hypothetical protein [candidate division KSB1 bacterium]
MDLNFGTALAFLNIDYENAIDDISDNFSETDRAKLEDYRSRFSSLESENRLVKIFSEIPKNRCEPGSSYLENNKDFFYAYILLMRYDVLLEKYGNHIANHLNDCYVCFEVFYHVIQDYIFALEQLQSQNDDGKGLFKGAKLKR